MMMSSDGWPAFHELPTSVGAFVLLERLDTAGASPMYLALPGRVVRTTQLFVLKKIRSASTDVVTDHNDLATRLEALSRIRHSSINNVVGLFRFGAHSLIASQFVAGLTLRQIIHTNRNQAVPVGLAVSVVARVARGLEALHGACNWDGVLAPLIHSEVNPGNIVVGYDGSVQLIDFGLTKLAESVHRTQLALLEGRAIYLAPEEIDGPRLSPPGDVYGLGVVLYQLVTGRAPFESQSSAQWFQTAKRASVIPPCTVRPEIPKGVEQLLMACLDKNPDSRPSAREVAEALEGIGSTVSTAGLARWSQSVDPAAWTVWKQRREQYYRWTWMDLAMTRGTSMDLADGYEDESSSIRIAEPHLRTRGLPRFESDLETSPDSDAPLPSIGEASIESSGHWLQADTLASPDLPETMLDDPVSEDIYDLENTRVDRSLDQVEVKAEPDTERPDSWKFARSEDSLVPTTGESRPLSTGDVLMPSSDDDSLDGTVPLEVESKDSARLEALPISGPPGSEGQGLPPGLVEAAVQDPAHRPSAISVPDVSRVALIKPPVRWPSRLGGLLLSLALVGVGGLVARNHFEQGRVSMPELVIQVVSRTRMQIKVRSDGQPLKSGPSPLSITDLKPGTHDLEIQVGDRIAQSLTVEMPSDGRTSIFIPLDS